MGEETSRAVKDRVELGGTIFITCFSPLDVSNEGANNLLGNVRDVLLLRSSG